MKGFVAVTLVTVAGVVAMGAAAPADSFTQVGAPSVAQRAAAASGGQVGAQQAAPASPADVPSCIPAAGQTAAVAGLTAEQTGIAKVAVEEAVKAGVGQKGAVLAVAAGLVESKLRNLPDGDRDSAGWLQQRPSQGWGSHAQVTDTRYAAAKFYEALKSQVPGWRGMPEGEVIQKVQRSAYPSRYQPRVGEAQSIVASVAGVKTCAEAPKIAAAPAGECKPSGSPAESGLQPVALRGLRCTKQAWPRIEQMGGLGDRKNKSEHPKGLAVDFMIDGWDTAAGRAYGWQVANWVTANADRLKVSYVIWDVKIWRNYGKNKGNWTTYTHPLGPTSNPRLLHKDHVHVSYTP